MCKLVWLKTNIIDQVHELNVSIINTVPLYNPEYGINVHVRWLLFGKIFHSLILTCTFIVKEQEKEILNHEISVVYPFLRKYEFLY